MHPPHPSQINLLPPTEQELRFNRLRNEMKAAGLPAVLVSDLANIYYLTGRVFAGYIYVAAEGIPMYFVRRPVGLAGDGLVHRQRKNDCSRRPPD